MLQKTQGTYFKISALYFKIYALYFSRKMTSDFQRVIKGEKLTLKSMGKSRILGAIWHLP